MGHSPAHEFSLFFHLPQPLIASGLIPVPLLPSSRPMNLILRVFTGGAHPRVTSTTSITYLGLAGENVPFYLKRRAMINPKGKATADIHKPNPTTAEIPDDYAYTLRARRPLPQLDVKGKGVAPRGTQIANGYKSPISLSPSGTGIKNEDEAAGASNTKVWVPLHLDYFNEICHISQLYPSFPFEDLAVDVMTVCEMGIEWPSLATLTLRGHGPFL
ncbi:hypothetical protein NUW58_g4055 [Xylaria curta]|uniref:Uncharacterized protein n=1 Tax=Xylaria curta TaxID=42375 RepID=A0ACC1P924_9PEZI|nr:hypothetical protein NUW58_g4055 [Xylaria curta]